MGSHHFSSKQNVAQSSQKHAPPTAVPQPPQFQQQPVDVKSNEEGLAEHAERLKKFQRLGNTFLEMGPPRLGNDTTSPLQPKPWIQPKRTTGEPGDKYEQEAERVSKQVTPQINASHGQSVNRKIIPGEWLNASYKSSTQQASMYGQRLPHVTPFGVEDLDNLPRVQLKNEVGSKEASTNLESAINNAKGNGKPLDAGLQKSMGQLMGANFSKVRVHSDARSDQLSQSIQARAFTTGQDIFFRAGAYQPGNPGGQELIAHELTHVVQQNGAIGTTTDTYRCQGKRVQRVETPEIPWSLKRKDYAQEMYLNYLEVMIQELKYMESGYIRMIDANNYSAEDKKSKKSFFVSLLSEVENILNFARIKKLVLHSKDLNSLLDKIKEIRKEKFPAPIEKNKASAQDKSSSSNEKDEVYSEEFDSDQPTGSNEKDEVYSEEPDSDQPTASNEKDEVDSEESDSDQPTASNEKDEVYSEESDSDQPSSSKETSSKYFDEVSFEEPVYKSNNSRWLPKKTVDKSVKTNVIIAVDKALEYIIKTIGKDKILISAFSLEKKEEAKKNFIKIYKMLEFWKKKFDVAVKIDKNENATHKACCDKEKKILFISKKSLIDKISKKSLIDKELPYILIHEASHAILSTNDLAYSYQTSFELVKSSKLGLFNADNYLFAAEQANNFDNRTKKLKEQHEKKYKEQEKLPEKCIKAIRLASYKALMMGRLASYLLIQFSSAKNNPKKITLTVAENQLKITREYMGLEKFSIFKRKNSNLEITEEGNLEITDEGAKLLDIYMAQTSILELSTKFIDHYLSHGIISLEKKENKNRLQIKLHNDEDAMIDVSKCLDDHKKMAKIIHIKILKQKNMFQAEKLYAWGDELFNDSMKEINRSKCNMHGKHEEFFKLLSSSNENSVKAENKTKKPK